jgi:hypothetical protein
LQHWCSKLVVITAVDLEGEFEIFSFGRRDVGGGFGTLNSSSRLKMSVDGKWDETKRQVPL